MPLNFKDLIEATDNLLGMLRNPDSNMRWAFATSRITISSWTRSAFNNHKIHLSDKGHGVQIGIEAFFAFFYGICFIKIALFFLLLADALLFEQPSFKNYFALIFLGTCCLWLGQAFGQTLQNLRGVWNLLNRRLQQQAIVIFIAPVLLIFAVSLRQF